MHQVATNTAFQGVIKDVIFNDNIMGFEEPISHRYAKIGRELREMKSHVDVEVWTSRTYTYTKRQHQLITKFNLWILVELYFDIGINDIKYY